MFVAMFVIEIFLIFPSRFQQQMEQLNEIHQFLRLCSFDITSNASVLSPILSTFT